MGATNVYNVDYRNYFVWIFSRGGKTFVESIIEDEAWSVGDYASSPVHVEVAIPKAVQGMGIDFIYVYNIILGLVVETHSRAFQMITLPVL